MDAYRFDHHIVKGRLIEGETLFSLEIGRRDKNRLPFILAGVDEAGRGPLAGPVVAAAVILPTFPRVKGLDDSKSLSEAERDALFPMIKKTALSMAVCVVEPEQIDTMNILAATMHAMRESIQGLRRKPDLVLVDGNQKPKSRYAELALVRGDKKSACVMAASIIAKVTRDKIMVELHEKYPNYGFNIHKGYAVPDHLEALKKFGPSPCHRQSFEPVKSMLSEPVATLF